MSEIVVRRLSQPDARLLLDNKDIDVPALQTQRALLRARLDKLADDYAEGVIDHDQLRTGTNKLRTKLAGVDSQLADAVRNDPVAGLIANRKQVQQRWDDSSPAIRGQVIDALMTVRVMPVPKGEREFDPHEGDPHHGVNIEWKR